MLEGERFNLNRKAGKAPEKSNFAQTCTLLGQFLKEKRNLGVVIPGNPETAKEKLVPETSSFRPPVATKNFLTSMGIQVGPSPTAPSGSATAATMVKSSDFFQQFKGFATTTTPSPVEDAQKPDLRKSTAASTAVKPESAQMTIFYAGQVLVFNNLPADKANEVMALARKGSSNVSGSVSPAPTPVVVEKIDLTKPAVPESNNSIATIPKPDLNKNDTDNKQENLQKRRADQAANGSDLPIARRNSLHRFLEKRKDRVAAKAPYQVENHRRPEADSPKPDGGDQGSQQEGECSDQHLELKL